MKLFIWYVSRFIVGIPPFLEAFGWVLFWFCVFDAGIALGIAGIITDGTTGQVWGYSFKPWFFTFLVGIPVTLSVALVLLIILAESCRMIFREAEKVAQLPKPVRVIRSSTPHPEAGSLSVPSDDGMQLSIVEKT